MRTPLALALVATLLVGCSQPVGQSSTTTATSSSLPSQPEAQAVDWSDPSIVAEYPGGWAVHACEGGAPLLCVERDGELVGTVEALSFPTESIDVIDPSAPTGDNLQALAASFVEAMTEDRAVGCGEGYLVEAIEPRPSPMGGNGLVYGFVGTTAEGAPSERNIQHATIVDGTVILIVAAAYDEGGCPGRDDTSGFDSATLGEFEPYLEMIIADSPLPDLVVP